ncbi:Phosphatidylglycerophosphatase A [Halioglobus japonicus]|nr:Phosphatidylglycerophosphatase A [Halioglobus japonicus]
MPTATTKHSVSHPAPDFRRHPVQFLAFGFGSGLSPKAPGTAGTLLALPLYLLIAQWSLLYYSAVVLLAAVVGVWICGAASRQLEVHDHPGIVWDEFVGFWITMWALPSHWGWVLAGFVAFRFFDIVKPWPISVLDRKVGGGFGIMIDDILAGVMACATLHIIMRVV